ncbi:NAD-dependent epimerase/dehydratase family protein [Brevundimonas vitis]|uniref:NAD-dependent epimerase/dehydratase family protein n=1 Tax=Brevundimonas vitisensis TaxID=2800818 RepID=A0ABX7BLU3_9CAUL|nr:NAD-dependent epimerase/dehydratase family protein [Brevundimonas vitisensis]QQQ18216.1 NAD-dependent epimerase/dehydratase family protein [Brevundimonas vitisensis]
MRFLITGSAGFIGFHLARRLLADGHQVAGVDNFSSYYDPELKEARNAQLERHHNAFKVHRLDLQDGSALTRAWEEARPDVVVHLAAQAGVRYSIDHPDSYVGSNLIGTYNILEAARRFKPRHLLAASTSSVYGANTEMPFRETDRAVHPVSLYAATKGATELMGHSYSHLFGIPTTFFRFFTVYGPWGRPDMALFKFTRAILAGEPIEVYGEGKMSRDFTYVDDLIEGIVRLAEAVPQSAAAEGDTLSPVAPFRVVNIGGGTPSGLMDYIAELERALGREAIKTFLPMQDGDVTATFASADLLENITGYRPMTPISVGVPAFVDWYRDHYGI